jgi:hypothetical protein
LKKDEKYVVNKMSPKEYLNNLLNDSRGSSLPPNDNEEDKDDLATFILNQSHESCCCSDDEFYSKSKNDLNTHNKMV